MTYYNLDKNGNKVGSETVTIKVKPITDGIFLVTWQEFDRRRSFTSRITIDRPCHQYHGGGSHLRSVSRTFRELS